MLAFFVSKRKDLEKPIYFKKYIKMRQYTYLTFLILVIAFAYGCRNNSKTDLTLPDKHDQDIRLSLAQWSFHRALKSGEMDNFQFIEQAAALGFTAVEYVNQFFKDQAKDTVFLTKLKEIATKNNIESLLIMIDDEGNLADTNTIMRNQAIENHKKWIDAAAFLGCHAIRVNLYGTGSREETASAGVEALGKLATYAAPKGMTVLVENHGGYSSDASWLANVIEKVNYPNLGTLPDFDNFCIQYEGGNMWGTNCIESFDKYTGMQLLMPFAGGVSAKSYNFGEMGYETTIDYNRMIEIVYNSGYSGYINIEYEGNAYPEEKGVLMTKQLLEKCIIEQKARR